MTFRREGGSIVSSKPASVTPTGRRAAAKRPRASERYGKFSGQPQTIWLTEEGADRRMTLLQPFCYLDPKGKPWEVEPGYTVDGATIPPALWSLIGSPYTGDYRRASIVHDKACDGATPAKRKEADQMFFYACRAGGCTWAEAAILYVGVRIGALLPLVKVWHSTPAGKRRPLNLDPSPADDRLVADFRLIANRVLAEGVTNDPKVVEDRTNQALAAVLALDPQLLLRAAG
jgi:hypothetical protein